MQLKTLYQKILDAQKATGWVAKNGRNEFHKYDYATEADILTVVKSAALEAGLIIITSTASEIGTYTIDKPPNREGYAQGSETVRWAKVILSYQVIEADTGEKIEGTFDGYAEDKSDKAIYKAMTGANKYFLMKFFGVATGDDPEKEETQPLPAKSTVTPPRPVAQIKPEASNPVKKPSKIESTCLTKEPTSPTDPPWDQPSTVSEPKNTTTAKVPSQVRSILSLMTAHQLTNDQVLEIGGIETLKGLDEATATEALNRLDYHVKEVMKG